MRRVGSLSIAVVAATGLCSLLTGCGGLSSNSTCADYNKASSADQRSFVDKTMRDAGASCGKYSLDLAHVAASAFCSARPSSSLTDLVVAAHLLK